MTPAPEKAAPIPALLPCPFCGGRAETWVLEHPEIQGGECGQYQGGCAVACAETPWCDTIEEVNEWWNRRADREARPSLPDSREEQQSDQDAARLDWLEANSNVHVQYEGWGEDVWEVYRVNGGRSDREWNKIAESSSLRDAIDLARQGGNNG